MSKVFITSDTVAKARNTLPLAHLSLRDVIDVQVIAADGNPAMIEFERVQVQAGDGKTAWSWEAMTCWQV
jgi:hypothetical protein